MPSVHLVYDFHSGLSFSWPPTSQKWKVTVFELPSVTLIFSVLNPLVGTVLTNSLNCSLYSTVVFPAESSPKMTMWKLWKEGRLEKIGVWSESPFPIARREGDSRLPRAEAGSHGYARRRATLGSCKRHKRRYPTADPPPPRSAALNPPHRTAEAAAGSATRNATRPPAWPSGLCRPAMRRRPLPTLQLAGHLRPTPPPPPLTTATAATAPRLPLGPAGGHVPQRGEARAARAPIARAPPSAANRRRCRTRRCSQPPLPRLPRIWRRGASQPAPSPARPAPRSPLAPPRGGGGEEGALRLAYWPAAPATHRGTRFLPSSHRTPRLSTAGEEVVASATAGRHRSPPGALPERPHSSLRGAESPPHTATSGKAAAAAPSAHGARARAPTGGRHQQLLTPLRRAGGRQRPAGPSAPPLRRRRVALVGCGCCHSSPAPQRPGGWLGGASQRTCARVHCPGGEAVTPFSGRPFPLEGLPRGKSPGAGRTPLPRGGG